jgi:hypothetical protein
MFHYFAHYGHLCLLTQNVALLQDYPQVEIADPVQMLNDGSWSPQMLEVVLVMSWEMLVIQLLLMLYH